MSENDKLDAHKQQEAIKRLAKDLAEIDAQILSTSIGDNEMLSLIVNEALKGVDISTRFPTFYRKLLNNPDLRQAFVDIVESIEDEKEKGLTVLPEMPKANLTFLTDLPPKSIVARLDENRFRINWQRTVEQLQAIFSPPELAYRSDPSLFEDPWFTLIREEIEVGEALYTVALECTLAGDTDEALSAFLNIAVTLETTTGQSYFPIQATLQWGAYDENLSITEEGRARFPDIPFISIFDNEYQSVKSDLNLTLDTNP